MILSIVIPTYNRSEILLERVSDYYQKVHKALSALKLEFEVIVVDDASQDDTRQICSQLGSMIENFVSIHLKQNLGPGPARNVAINCAKGDYIWFLDDDDIILSTHLNLLFECILAGADVVAHSLQKKYDYHTALFQNVLLFREKQEVFNYVIKKELIKNAQIQFSNNLHEDIAFVYKVLCASKNLQIIKQEIVQKIKMKNAITSTLSLKRVDGLIASFNEISVIKQVQHASDLDLHTAFLGVILYLIQKSETELAHHLIEYLQKHPFAKIFLEEKAINGKKLTNFEVAGEAFTGNLQATPQSMLKQLRSIFTSYVSCKDLQSSLFLGPDEIRGCCKRFFQDGQRRGDVVLMQADASINLEKINKSKKELVDAINTGTPCECTGCPYLTRYSSASESKQIDYISFENFSYCNMRCSYCSPKYFGGAEAKYDTLTIIDDLFSDRRQISDQLHVVFGGGEPTLSQKFSDLNKILISESKVFKVRLLSNSLRQSSAVEELLKDERYHLVTSIDAGTQAKFKEIRGRGDLDTVLSNLHRYNRVIRDKQRITLKYIITYQNFSMSELISYVDLLSKYQLLDCLFQISCDFTIESPIDEMITAIFQLYCLLYEAGASFVYIDDLIRDRVSITDELYNNIESKISHFDVLCDLSGAMNYVVWGRGLQADWLTKHTQLGRSGLIKEVVSNSVEFENFITKHDINSGSVAIIPAGVQSTHDIISNITSAGYENLILRKVII